MSNDTPTEGPSTKTCKSHEPEVPFEICPFCGFLSWCPKEKLCWRTRNGFCVVVE